MLQVVAYPAGLTHAGRGDDDLRFRIRVYRHGFLAGYCDLKIRECYRIDALTQKLERIIIVILVHLRTVNICSFNSERAVYINRETVMAFYQAFFLDYPDVVQELLRPADSECRYDQVSAPVKSCLYDVGELLHVVRLLRMDPVAVGGFTYDVICLRRILRGAYERLIHIAKVSREQQRSFDIPFPDSEQYVGRSEQMPGVDISDGHTVKQRNLCIVSRGPEERHGLENVLRRIERNVFFVIGPLALAVAPCSFKFLYVRRISEHYVAELACGLR